MKKLFIVLFAASAAILSSSCTHNCFTRSDRQIIMTNKDSLLHIYTVDNPQENLVLREKSYDMTKRTLKTSWYRTLAHRMIVTVSDSTVGGVGIAGPQVGINKRIVAVQRFDKPGEPFEAYPNIHIIEYSEEKQCGPEGCLSVPGKRGEVERSEQIVIQYTDLRTMTHVKDTVKGFTAVIFQHEVDHLEGVIYTDKADEIISK